jgi:hypothetical protein
LEGVAAMIPFLPSFHRAELILMVILSAKVATFVKVATLRKTVWLCVQEEKGSGLVNDHIVSATL